MDAVFSFEADLWRWKDEGSWIFASVPIEVAEEIHDMPLPVAGFGSVAVEVRVGESNWSTSVFPDKASGSFVLPVKKAIRAREGLDEGDRATFELTIRVP